MLVEQTKGGIWKGIWAQICCWKNEGTEEYESSCTIYKGDRELCILGEPMCNSDATLELDRNYEDEWGEQGCTKIRSFSLTIEDLQNIIRILRHWEDEERYTNDWEKPQPSLPPKPKHLGIREAI